MFDKTDPRAALGSGNTVAATPAPADTGIALPHYADFFAQEPAETSARGSRTWLVRGQNFVLSYTTMVAGDELRRPAGQDEYISIIPAQEGSFTYAAGSGQERVNGQAVIVVPPGESSITAIEDSDVVRLFDIRTADLAAAASNADDYAIAHPRVAPLEIWPEPADGYRLRVYPVGDIAPEAGRFGRIFRTRTLMVNFMYPFEGPRDPAKLSPHHHDDFEQGSLAVAGDFDHHIRTPWTTDLNEWREDEHRSIGSPSVAIIPPPTIHTTRATGAGTNVLIDIFSPPREDFSDQPGWVLNAADYPRQ
jgi:mannose-6-phosphate isomerase-like protein (cupin superfamily)